MEYLKVNLWNQDPQVLAVDQRCAIWACIWRPWERVHIAWAMFKLGISFDLKPKTLNELIKRRKRLQELEVQCYVAQIVNALKYLH